MEKRQFKIYLSCLFLSFFLGCDHKPDSSGSFSIENPLIQESKHPSLKKTKSETEKTHKHLTLANPTESQTTLTSQEVNPKTETVTTPETEISFPFFIENEKQQDIPALVSANKLFSLESLNSQLEGWVFPATISELKKNLINKNGKNWVSIESINSAGIVTIFNELSQELRLTIPAILKKDQAINLGGNNNIVIPDSAIRANKFSSYFNLNAKQPFAYSNSMITQNNGRQSFYSQAESVTNVDSFILDLNGEYDEQRSFKRNDFRIIKDDPENMVRYTVGDIMPMSGGFLNGRPSGGISAARDFSLQPNKTTTPINSYKIFIKRPSSIKIFVNGMFSQTMYLSSGTYDIRNLPVAVGTNNISLEVTDDLGQKEIVDIPSFSFSQQNLKQGISQFNYSVGLPYSDSLTQRTYEKDNTTYSLSHRYGLTNQLTLGAYNQGDAHQSIFGLGSTISTHIGVFSLEQSYSKIYSSSVGFGSRLNYTFLGKKLQNNFSLNLEKKTSKFAQLGNLNPNNTDLLNIETSYYQPFGKTGVTLTNTYGINSEGENPWSASIGLSKNFTSDFSASGSMSYGKGGDGVPNTAIAFNLNWVISPTQNLSANYLPKTDEYSAQYRYSKEVNKTDKIDTFLVDSGSQSGHSINSDLRYYGRHGYLGLQESEQDKSLGSRGTQVSSTTSIIGGFSLAYAGGAFALYQPINDSFVILKPDDKLKGQDLIINPSNDKNHPYSAKSDWLSNAILPISAYQLGSVQVGTPHLVDGLSLDKLSFELYPSYRSGITLEIKVVSFISIKGTIVDANNKPITLYDGIIRNDAGDLAVPIYTTEDGVFFVEGIRPGKYIVNLKDEQESVFNFEISPESFGVVDLGIVKATATK